MACPRRGTTLHGVVEAALAHVVRSKVGAAHCWSNLFERRCGADGRLVHLVAQDAIVDSSANRNHDTSLH